MEYIELSITYNEFTQRMLRRRRERKAILFNAENSSRALRKKPLRPLREHTLRPLRETSLRPLREHTLRALREKTKL